MWPSTKRAAAALQRGRQVGDDDRRRAARQARQRAQALRDDVGVRRELVVGQHFLTREREDRQRCRREEPELRLELVGAGAHRRAMTRSAPAGRPTAAARCQGRAGAREPCPAHAGCAAWQ